MKLGKPYLIEGILTGDGATTQIDESCRPSSQSVSYYCYNISTINDDDTNTPKARLAMKLATGPVYSGLGPTYVTQASASDPEDQQTLCGGDADSGGQFPGQGILVTRECYPIVIIGTDATKIANTKKRNVYYCVRRVLEQ